MMQQRVHHSSHLITHDIHLVQHTIVVDELLHAARHCHLQQASSTCNIIHSCIGQVHRHEVTPKQCTSDNTSAILTA